MKNNEGLFEANSWTKVNKSWASDEARLRIFMVNKKLVKAILESDKPELKKLQECLLYNLDFMDGTSEDEFLKQFSKTK